MAAPNGTFVTLADLQGRVSAAVVQEIFDDDATGTYSATEDTYIQSFILDGESDVLAWVGPAYGADDLDALVALGTSVARRVKTLCLDAIEIRIGRRYPAYLRGDWEQRKKELDLALERLRLRVTSLATSAAPEPAANEGGLLSSGDPDADDYPDTIAPTFLRGIGDYAG